MFAAHVERRRFHLGVLRERLRFDLRRVLHGFHLAGQHQGTDLQAIELRRGQRNVLLEGADPAGLIFARQEFQLVLARRENIPPW